MTTLVANTFSWVGFTGIATWLKKLDAQLTKRRRISSTIRELSALTDKELWDIGIARGDIWSIAHEDASFKRVADTNKNLKGWV